MRRRVPAAVVLQELQRRDDFGDARVQYLQRRDARRSRRAERNSARAEDSLNENPALTLSGNMFSFNVEFGMLDFHFFAILAGFWESLC